MVRIRFEQEFFRMIKIASASNGKFSYPLLFPVVTKEANLANDCDQIFSLVIAIRI
jgi:hypothetical protein